MLNNKKRLEFQAFLAFYKYFEEGQLPLKIEEAVENPLCKYVKILRVKSNS